MSASLAAFVVADRAASPAARFGRLGRLAAAGTLVLGASFQGALWIASTILRAREETA